MAVVWGWLQDHNGHIEVHTSPEEGSRLELFFPSSDTESICPLSETAADLRGNRETVPVVDDVPEQREIATGILQELGYLVRSASSGEEAVACFETRTADVVPLDTIMTPGMDGLETLRRILASHPRQQVFGVGPHRRGTSSRGQGIRQETL